MSWGAQALPAAVRVQKDDAKEWQESRAKKTSTGGVWRRTNLHRVRANASRPASRCQGERCGQVTRRTRCAASTQALPAHPPLAGSQPASQRLLLRLSEMVVLSSFGAPGGRAEPCARTCRVLLVPWAVRGA